MGAFQGQERVENVVVPDGVESLGNFCFSDCYNLTTVTLPSSLKEIGGGAFQGTGLKEIEIPSGVKVIERYTFQSYQLVKVSLPKTLKRIESYAFSGCAMLEPFQLPEGLEYIGDRAFSDCRKITEVFIPAGVKEIGNSPYNSRTITSIKVDPRNSRYESPEGSNVLIDKSTGSIIQGCPNSVIPQGIKEIGYAAFDGCIQIPEIIIPEGVERIGDYAFRGCSAYITIPSSVKEIGPSAFLVVEESKVTNNSGLEINYGQQPLSPAALSQEIQRAINRFNQQNR